jgi:hypothetical protein
MSDFCESKLKNSNPLPWKEFLEFPSENVRNYPKKALDSPLKGVYS